MPTSHPFLGFWSHYHAVQDYYELSLYHSSCTPGVGVWGANRHRQYIYVVTVFKFLD